MIRSPAVVALFLLVPACAPARGSTVPQVQAEPFATAKPVAFAPTEPPKAPEAEKPAKPTFPASISDAAEKLTKAAIGSTRAWDRLALVSDKFGHRLSGSKSLEQAIDWAVETMKADGLADARREKVMVPRWVRGKERARVISPVVRELVLLGLGGTVGTPAAGLRAEVVVVKNLEELETRGAELKGKVVVINQPMPPYDHEADDAHYGGTVVIRSRGASAAAKHGAKAVLIRSVTAHELRTPHTGALNYEAGVTKIPAAAITIADAEFLARSAARGPTKIDLFLGAKTLPDSESGNAIAELRGREKPNEIVVIGGHIDSWDVGDGAHDDGAGCLMAMEAAAMLQELGLVPRRTIRVVLFTNEENGLRGGTAYHAAHGKEVHAGAIESDSGGGAPKGFGVVGDDKVVADLAKYSVLFKGLGASEIERGWGGANISPLTKDGVLSLSVHPDTSSYFDYHHSPADTVNTVDPVHLQKNAAAMALMAFILAERE